MNTQRTRFRVLAAAACAGLFATFAYAAPPPTAAPGDTIAEVVAKLGKPQGSMTRGRVTTYYYDRGLINFVDGRVQSDTLVTPEEAARIRREQDQADRLRREQKAAQQQAAVEGQAELKARRSDAAFLAQPVAERLAYWEDFHKRYPDLDVSADLAAAKSAADAGTGRDAKTDELNALRTRVDAIRARLVQLDADYAASLANWKRNEIDAERAKLMAELDAALQADRPAQPAATNNAAAAP